MSEPRCVPAAPAWQQYLLAVVRGERRGLAAALTRGALSVGAGLYRGSLEGYLLGCRSGLLAVTRAGVPVVSVGNITVGGTGKTSAVMAIARQLMAEGMRPAVLSRGYGGCRAGVVSDGESLLMPPQESGDEPRLLAERLPDVPVLVGKDRRQGARTAVGDLGAGSLVLDDGFQYWRLRKDLEIVLVDALNPFDNGRVLPAGLLREPVGHLQRADAVWVTHADLAAPEQRQAVADRVRTVGAEIEVSFARHLPARLRAWQDKGALEMADLAERRVVALSSIGNPGAFERTLQRLGAIVVPVRFPDHHPYRQQDLEAVQSLARQEGAAAVVTTEKDEIRLPNWAGEPPLWVLGVEMTGLEGEPLVLSPRLLEELRRCG